MPGFNCEGCWLILFASAGIGAGLGIYYLLGWMLEGAL